MRPASGFWEDIEKKMHNYYWPKPYLPLSSHIIRFCHFELSDCYTLEMFGTFRIFRFEKTQKKNFYFFFKAKRYETTLNKTRVTKSEKKNVNFPFSLFYSCVFLYGNFRRLCALFCWFFYTVHVLRSVVISGIYYVFCKIGLWSFVLSNQPR